MIGMTRSSTNWRTLSRTARSSSDSSESILKKSSMATGWDGGNLRAGRWNGGTAERWNGGTVERWNGGTVDRWNGGTVERWNGGTVERWNGGTVERWNGGTVERCGLTAQIDRANHVQRMTARLITALRARGDYPGRRAFRRS